MPAQRGATSPNRQQPPGPDPAAARDPKRPWEMQTERANSSLQTYLDDGRPVSQTYRRSTSAGFYSTLSRGLRRSLSPDQLHPQAASGADSDNDEDGAAGDTRVLLPALRQARGLAFQAPGPKAKVDLLLTEGASAMKSAAGNPQLSSSLITQLANAEMYSVMHSLGGQVKRQDKQNGSVSPPTTQEEADAQLRARNLKRGLHTVDEEIKTAKNKDARNAHFAAKIKETSPHLFRPNPHKVSGGVGSKERSFKQRTEDLEAKLNALRWDERKVDALREDLKIRKVEEARKLYERGEYIKTNCSKLLDGFYAYEGQLQRMNAMVQDREKKTSSCQQQRRDCLIARKAEINQDIALRAKRKQVYAQERARYEFQLAKSNWQRVILPMVVAAMRFVVWSNAIPAGRARREHEEQVRAADQIRIHYKMVKQAREQRRQMKIRRFIRRHLWWMRLQQRIRIKSRAHDVLVPFVRDVMFSRKVVLTVRQYIWKIICIQRHFRGLLQCRHACMCAYSHQWDKICSREKKRTQTWGVGSGSGTAAAPRGDTSHHPPPSPAPGPAPAKHKKKKAAGFENINFLLLPNSSDPMVEELLRERLYIHLREYSGVLEGWREEHQSWQGDDRGSACSLLRLRALLLLFPLTRHLDEILRGEGVLRG
jgi:hypothetical protein